ncbi:MAG: hypothetical protein JWN70_3625 [Planctomycetaceae bacterium]|nr:hypothetical protein [Planctomycetaceae bacterium]
MEIAGTSGMFLGRLLRLSLMELGLQALVLPLTEGLLDKFAGLPTFTARKPLGLDTRLTVGGDDDLDCLAHTAPPT